MADFAATIATAFATEGAALAARLATPPGASPAERPAAGAEAERIRPQIAAAVREVLAEFDEGDGVRAPASSWIVSATAPAD